METPGIHGNDGHPVDRDGENQEGMWNVRFFRALRVAGRSKWGRR